MSFGIGAYFDFISIVARATLPTRSLLTTVPTVTPEIRTSASFTSRVASVRSAVKR